MKRIGYTSLATIALMLGAALAFATPMPNSAIIDLRLWNDCGTSTIAPVINNYPALISITDTMHPACVGFANRHAWSFSEGFGYALFINNSHFRFSADVTISGNGEGEGGLHGPHHRRPVVGRERVVSAQSDQREWHIVFHRMGLRLHCDHPGQ